MLVDIIIPSHNPKYLGETLDSCLSQSYKNIRITVIDDCSDNWPKNIKEKYKNVSFIKTERNMGPAGARNFGIKKTSGDLISFIDDDDIMHQDKILSSVNEFKKNKDIGMVCGNYQILVNRKKLLKPFYKKNIDVNWKSLMRQNFVASGSVTVRRSVIDDVGLFDERFWIAEDYNLWLRISEKYPIKYIHKVLYYYSVMPGSQSLTQRNDIQKNHIENIKIIKSESLKRINYGTKE